ncbi:MAG: flavodoxin [Dehalococcoidia bacterium]|nr:MAG: flavodoxin [Dehalococcoidia bacterium]TEU17795.1 MAG: flavodoxin [Dehalococcoidia bacterium]
MKALIIYISVHHGNTERVAKVMTDILNADLLQVKQVATSMLEQYDLIGFGSGIYFGKHHKNLLNFVDMLSILRNKKAFIFSTSGLRKIQFIHNFDKPLKERLRRKGFDIIGEFSCRGLDTYRVTKLVGGVNKGRPDTEDLRQAEDFAKSLKNSGASYLN